MRFQRLEPEGVERPVVMDEQGRAFTVELRVGPPVVFMKASNTVVGPDDGVLIPRGRAGMTVGLGTSAIGDLWAEL